MNKEIITPTRKPTKPNETLAKTGINAVAPMYIIAIIPMNQSQNSIGKLY